MHIHALAPQLTEHAHLPSLCEQVTKGAPKGRKLNMYSMHWIELDGKVCYRQGDDLVCNYPDAYTVSPNFFNRIAYHMFASIAGRDIKTRTADEILNGNWPITDLYRQALGLEVTSDGERRRDVSVYRPGDTPDPEYVAAVGAALEGTAGAAGTISGREEGHGDPTTGLSHSRAELQSGPSDAIVVATGTPIPVWLWMDYKDTPGYIQLNLRSLAHNAPAPRFQIRQVTRDMLSTLVPDMPVEFDSLPYAAAVSDLIRTALIAHHGGFYLDTDFLVQKPLAPIADMLSK